MTAGARSTAGALIKAFQILALRDEPMVWMPGIVDPEIAKSPPTPTLRIGIHTKLHRSLNAHISHSGRSMTPDDASSTNPYAS